MVRWVCLGVVMGDGEMKEMISGERRGMVVQGKCCASGEGEKGLCGVLDAVVCVGGWLRGEDICMNVVW